jgi:hypothetical protein
MLLWVKSIVSTVHTFFIRANNIPATLRLAEHVTNLYLHEIALHKDQGGTDLHPPYTEESVTPGGKANLPIGPAHIGALGECLTATHGILDTMLSIPLDVLLTLPVIFCESKILCARTNR